MTEHVFEVGDIFEERYEILETLGEGGFAVVYLARQLDLNRKVALKILRTQIGEGGRSREDDDSADEHQTVVGRFKREAKLVSQLNDPHIITMYDYGETDDELLYMVFEFVDGIDLKEYLQGRDAMEPERVVKIMCQTLEGLEDAHSHGVLHRDLKPGNIMLYEHLRREDQVKLLDFGIATSALDRSKDLTAELTEEGAIVGTPRYMSPEQIWGHELKPSSDIYSLGLVCYEMLAGRKAIDGDSSIEIISNQIKPESIEPSPDMNIPAGLRDILRRMLRKDADLRYQSAEDVLVALEGWDRRKEDNAGLSQEITAGGQVEMGPLSGEERTSAPSDESRDRRWMWIAVVLLVLGGAGAVAATMMTDDAEPTEESAPFGIQKPGEEKALAAESGSEASKPAQEVPAGTTPEPTVETLHVETNPTGVGITAGGTPVGNSPRSIEVTEDEFPLEIVATHPDGRTERVVLDGPTENVKIEFEPESVESDAPEPSPEQGVIREPEPQKRKPSKPEKPKPARPDKTQPPAESDEPDDGGEDDDDSPYFMLD